MREKESSSSSCNPYGGCKKIRLEFDWSKSSNENLNFQVEMNTKDGLNSSGSKCSGNSPFMRWYDPTKKRPKVGVVDIDLEKAWCEEKMFDTNYFFIRADWNACKKGCGEGDACLRVICDGETSGEYKITPGANNDCPLTLVGELGYNSSSKELEFLVEGKEGEKCCAVPCEKVCVTLISTGCCLHMGPGFVEAVGKGTVRAEANLPSHEKCEMMLLLNGEERDSIEVEDGDRIDVDVIATKGPCACCEVGMECLKSSSVSCGPSVSSSSSSTSSSSSESSSSSSSLDCCDPQICNWDVFVNNPNGINKTESIEAPWSSPPFCPYAITRTQQVFSVWPGNPIKPDVTLNLGFSDACPIIFVINTATSECMPNSGLDCLSGENVKVQFKVLAAKCDINGQPSVIDVTSQALNGTTYAEYYSGAGSACKSDGDQFLEFFPDPQYTCVQQNFWVKKDNQITEFTKKELVKRIKFVTQKVIDRKRRLR